MVQRTADFQQIYADARKFSSMYQGFLRCAEVLGDVGSLSAAADEAQYRLDHALKGEAELKKKHEQMAADALAAVEERRAQLDHECKNLEAIKISRQAEFDALEVRHSELSERVRSLQSTYAAAREAHDEFLRKFAGKG